MALFGRVMMSCYDFHYPPTFRRIILFVSVLLQKCCCGSSEWALLYRGLLVDIKSHFFYFAGHLLTCLIYDNYYYISGLMLPIVQQKTLYCASATYPTLICF